MANSVRFDLIDEVQRAFSASLRRSFPLAVSANTMFSRDGFPRQELIEFLEDEDAVRARVDDVSPLRRMLPSTGLDIATDGFEERGLAATRGTENHEAIGSQHIEARRDRLP